MKPPKLEAEEAGSKSESGDDDAEKESPRSPSASSYWVAVPRDEDMRNEDDSTEVPTEGLLRDENRDTSRPTAVSSEGPNPKVDAMLNGDCCCWV